MLQSDFSEQIRSAVFAEPGLERCICAAGTKQLARYVEKRRLGKGFAVLSDFALYCKGRWYFNRRDDKPKKRKLEYRLDLPVLESVKLVSRKPFWAIVLCFVFLILAPLLLLLDKLTGYGASTALTPWLDAAVCLALSLFFLTLHFALKQRLLQIKFRGGTLSIDSRDLPGSEERRMLRCLREILDVPGRAGPQQSHHRTQL